MSGVHSIHYPTITANLLRVCSAKAPLDLISNEKFFTVLLKIFQEDHDLLSTSNVFEALRILTGDCHENKLQTTESVEKIRRKFSQIDGFLNRCRKFIIKTEYEDEQLGQKIFQNAQILLDRLTNYEKSTNATATLSENPHTSTTQNTTNHSHNPNGNAANTITALPSSSFPRQPLAVLAPHSTTANSVAPGLKAPSTHCIQLKVCGYNGSDKHKSLLENSLQKITGVVSISIGGVILGDNPNCYAVSVYTTARPQLILRNVLDAIHKISTATSPSEQIFKAELLPMNNPGLATPAAPKQLVTNSNVSVLPKSQVGIVAVDNENNRQNPSVNGYSSTLSRFMSGATRFFVGAK